MSGTGWQSQLRARGYRLTPQRQLVLEAVAALGHATPEEIGGQVRRTASTVNVSTVYRTLELLEELGLVRHAHLGHGPASYSVAWEDGHVHLVCRACGRLDEVESSVFADLVERLRAERGFVADVGHAAVFGDCADCTGKATP